jgi:hypothetical protein
VKPHLRAVYDEAVSVVEAGGLAVDTPMVSDDT